MMASEANWLHLDVGLKMWWGNGPWLCEA